MKPHYADDQVTVYAGDCLDVLKTLADNSIDAVVTDPPYGLEFMGKDWDSFKKNGYFPGGGPKEFSDGRDRMSAPRYEAGVPFQSWCELWAIECLRVLNPGGHMLAFGGTRTWHRLACAIEDAGFEIRDSIAWLYGSGFPKSLDVSKAIDKAAGAEREVVGSRPVAVDQWTDEGRAAYARGDASYSVNITAPATDAAKQWQGWGTALKPAFEPIVVARKPLQAGTVAANVLAWGTGALNVDGCRVQMSDADRDEIDGKQSKNPTGNVASGVPFVPGVATPAHTAGRWPANVVLDGDMADELDKQSGNVQGAVSNGKKRGSGYRENFGEQTQTASYGDSGGASRFFPVFKNEEQPQGRWPANVVLDGEMADELDKQSGTLTSGTIKAGTKEKIGSGIYGAYNSPGKAETFHGDSGGASRFFPTFRYTAKAPGTERPTADGVSHPTVKPLDLMRWLVRLVTPPGGTVLDLFAGSGTTGEAAVHEHRLAVLVEREPSYLPLIVARLSKPMEVGFDFEGTA